MYNKLVDIKKRWFFLRDSKIDFKKNDDVLKLYLLKADSLAF